MAEPGTPRFSSPRRCMNSVRPSFSNGFILRLLCLFAAIPIAAFGLNYALKKTQEGLEICEAMATLGLLCALSSGVEHQYHTLGVAGSKPAARTILPLIQATTGGRPSRSRAESVRPCALRSAHSQVLGLQSGDQVLFRQHPFLHSDISHSEGPETGKSH